jgi:hypothetical protein
VFGFGLTLLSALVPELKQLLKWFLAFFYFGKFLQQLLLTFIKVHWRFDLNIDMKITPSMASQTGYPLPSQADKFAALRSRRDVNAPGAIQSLEFNGVPQGCLHHGYGNLAVEMAAIPFKKLVWFYVQPHIKITGRATPMASLTLVGNAETCAGVDTRWYLN